MKPAALALAGVSVAAGATSSERRRWLVRDVHWQVESGEHWVVLGPNGAGKSTLLGTAAGTLRPTTGEVTVLGERHGAPGHRDPRLRIAQIEGRPRAFARRLTATDVVLLRPAGSVALRGERIRDEEVCRARGLLARFGCAAIQGGRFADCSQGERQRVLLARALMRDPALLLLDEPVAALDLPGREAFLHVMARLAEERPGLATVTVAHRLEDVSPSTTHALIIRDGTTVAAGPIEEVLTTSALSACFGMPVRLTRAGGRWSARAQAATPAS
jgi:iron complex transport system ATP-binding protein